MSGSDGCLGKKKTKQNEGVESDRRGYFRKEQLGKANLSKEGASELRRY